MYLQSAILFLLMVLQLNEVEPSKTTSIVLPFRPVSSNRAQTIHFSTKVITLRKEYNLRAHEKYFHNIINLWTSIFMENELKGTYDQTLDPKNIDELNPECRDLRSVVMDGLKSVTELIDSHTHTRNRLRTKRRTHRTKTLSSKSTTLIFKRSFLAKSAITMMGSYMASQGVKEPNTVIEEGLLPFGGRLLAIAFGVARAKDVELNRRKNNLLADQFIKLQENQGELIKFANITSLLIKEMSEIIHENDIDIVNLFNITNENQKIHRRSMLCLRLYSESSYLIETVRTTISNFIMADTLLPQGNKNLFSEAELKNLLSRNTEQTLATGERNFWDYSLFNIIKLGNKWTYEIQIPLTNLPMFTVYKLAPFPVFPIPNNGTALTVDIPTDSTVILSSDDKYFIDKIDRECTYSDTHGICPGPVGLIDTDFCDCKVGLMLFETDKMLNRCRFIQYKDHFPRIASSMGKFIISSTDEHAFILSCNNTRSHITTKPGTNMLTIPTGCSLNTTDIKLLNPNGMTPITNQKLDLDTQPIFRFQKQLPLDKYKIKQPEEPKIKKRLHKLEQNHATETEFNKHLRLNSATYVSIMAIIILLIIITTTILYFKLSVISPIITIMRKYWLQNKTIPKTPPTAKV